MTTIGLFVKTAHGYRGTLRTLMLDTKLTIVEIEKQGDGPDYRVFAGQAEVGAGWKCTDQACGDYVSLRLDDPTFAAPINANLTEIDGEYCLIWSR
ncbi:MAG: DUF736 domain-containing protein [Rhodospirillales bacterium]|nr:DUF736 domain-containing protein [Rhodospirillales bacterium]